MRGFLRDIFTRFYVVESNWYWGDYREIPIGQQTINVTHTYAASGSTFVWAAVIRGSYGAGFTNISSDQAQVKLNLTVLPSAPTPGANAGEDKTVQEGESVVLTGICSNVSNYSAGWKILNADKEEVAQGSCNSMVFSTKRTGVYTGIYTATNGSVTVGDSTIITIVNHAPVITTSGSSIDNLFYNLNASFTDTGEEEGESYVAMWRIYDKDMNLVTVTTSLDYQFALGSKGPYLGVFSVIDENGGFASDTVTINPTNVAPTVSVDQSNILGVEDEQVNLAGSFADPGKQFGEKYTVSWNVYNESNEVVATSNQESFSFTPGNSGMYRAVYTVVDEDGGTSSATSLIEIAEAHPQVNAGNNLNVNQGQNLNVTGIVTLVSGHSGEATTVGWKIYDKDLNLVYSASGLNLKWTPNIPGVYEAEFYALDNDDDPTSSTISITVADLAPVTSVGSDISAKSGDAITLAGNFTDPGQAAGELYDIRWVVIDGRGTVVGSGTGKQLEFTIPKSDIFTGVFTVTDPQGKIGTSYLLVTAVGVTPTSSTSGDQNINEGESVTLVGSLNDPDLVLGGIKSSSWKIMDSMGNEVASGTGMSTSFTPSDDGDYVATLKILGNTGVASYCSASIHVANVAPTILISGDTSVYEGVSYDISFSANDPGTDTISSWTVNWGDGENGQIISSTTHVEHTYKTSGSYSIVISAGDEDGTYSSNSKSVLVKPLPQIVTFPQANQTIQVTKNVVLSAKVNGLPEMQYQWFKDDVAITGATSTDLSLTNASLSDEGTYLLKITVPGVTVTSLPITVSVIPMVSDDTIYRCAGAPTKIAVSSLLANDLSTNGGTITFVGTSVSSLSGARVYQKEGWVFYVPASGASNQFDQFTYTVQDTLGRTATGTVTVGIQSQVTSEVGQTQIGVTPGTGSSMIIRFVGIPGRNYTIEFTTSLTSPSWNILGLATARTDGIYEYQDTEALLFGQRYYRVTSP